MCELGQFDSVFFACKSLIVTTFPNVVNLNRLVALRSHTKLARVIEVDREHMRRGLRAFAVLRIVAWEELGESAQAGIGFIQLYTLSSAGKLK